MSCHPSWPGSTRPSAGLSTGPVETGVDPRAKPGDDVRGSLASCVTPSVMAGLDPVIYGFCGSADAGVDPRARLGDDVGGSPASCVTPSVMAGLVPAIHGFCGSADAGVDPRGKSGDDVRGSLASRVMPSVMAGLVPAIHGSFFRPGRNRRGSLGQARGWREGKPRLVCHAIRHGRARPGRPRVFFPARSKPAWIPGSSPGMT